MYTENEGSIYPIGTKVRLRKARWGYPKGKVLTLGSFVMFNKNEYRLDSERVFVWVNEESLLKYCEVV